MEKVFLKLKHHKDLLLIVLFLAVLATVPVLALTIYYSGKIFPEVYIANYRVSEMTADGAESYLSQNIKTPEKINLLAKGKIIELSLKDIEFAYNFQKSSERAFITYRSGNFFSNLKGRLTSIFNPMRIDLVIAYNEERLDEYLELISTDVFEDPVYPSASFVDNTVAIDIGSTGEKLDKKDLERCLETNLSAANFSPIPVPFKNEDPTLTSQEAENLKARAEKFIGKTLTLKNEYDQFALREKELFPFLDVRANFNETLIDQFIQDKIVPNVNREPQNAVFRFEGGRVIEFLPAKDGLTINQAYLKKQIIEKLIELESTEPRTASVDIPVDKTPPLVTTKEVNDLGIIGLLGRGSSKFKGSIPGRIHNISLASSKFKGVLVPPGAIFSFNEILGDVSVYTGYKQAYVIKDGKTVLGDGGGVCQVSSTLFRAVLNAGLPVVERRAHSYRVGYYEQDSSPGLDATVFAPTTDFKFKNDTPAHLLIQTLFDAKNSSLVFEIYGSSDGRISEISKPKILSSTPPPEDLYIDDPMLPAGQIKQTEHKAWGAKVTFDYKVTRSGEVIYEKNFVSSYRPWQAVYLRGTLAIL